MHKFKNWLYNNFLPMWAKETVLQDNKRLSAENYRLQNKVRELEAYAKGLETANKLRKIVINEVSK